MKSQLSSDSEDSIFLALFSRTIPAFASSQVVWAGDLSAITQKYFASLHFELYHVIFLRQNTGK